VAGRDTPPVNAEQLDRRLRQGHAIEAQIATNGQPFRSVCEMPIVTCNCIDKQ
jgi:hypothetical protein